MSATEPLVKISNLEIDGIADETRTRIINNVSLELNRGEVMGLIGESGAGKSTLGLAAMGFTRDGCEIVGGNIMFDGIDLITATPDVKRQLLGKRIALVFPIRCLFWGYLQRGRESIAGTRYQPSHASESRWYQHPTIQP